MKRILILAAVASAFLAHAAEYNVSSDDIDDFTNKVANAKSGDRFVLAAGEYVLPDQLALGQLENVSFAGAGCDRTRLLKENGGRFLALANVTNLQFSGVAFCGGIAPNESSVRMGSVAKIESCEHVFFDSCAFLTNSSANVTGNKRGCGAIYGVSSKVHTSNCLFQGNWITHGKRAAFASIASCVYMGTSCAYTSTNDVFRDNRAWGISDTGEKYSPTWEDGEVLYVDGNSTGPSTATLVNALVTGNGGTEDGQVVGYSLMGAITQSTLNLYNCTVAGNNALISVNGGNGTYRNSIFRDATQYDLGASKNKRYVYNCFYGTRGVAPNTESHCSTDNPSLTDDFYLSPSSAAVDFCTGESVEGTPYADLYSAVGDAKDTGVLDAGYHHPTPGAAAKRSLAGAVIAPVPNQALFDMPVQPIPEVTLDGESLTYNADYTVSYANNDKVGTATLTISGIGLYEGTESTTFTVFAAYENTTIDVGSFAALKKAIADSRSNCVFRLAAGRHEMSETLVLDGKDGLTVAGSPEGETALVKAGGRLLFVRNARGATFRNLTLQGGTGVADAPELGNGATIACVGAAAKLVGATDVLFEACAFRTNSISGSAASFASNGGTVAAQDSGVRFAGCLFEGNSVVCGNSGNWHAHGAGLLLYGSSSAVMINVVFRGNYYGNSSVGANQQDGLFCWANTGSSAKLINCIAEGNGGEADFSARSTCLFAGGNVQLENCTLASNGVRKAVCASSLTLTNSIVVGASEYDLVKSSKLWMYDSFYGTLNGSPNVSKGCSTEDPLLTTDCFLRHGSPAINSCEGKVAGTPYAALWAEKRFRPDTGLLDCGFHHLACPVPVPGLMLMVR